MNNFFLFIDFDFTITTDDVGNRFYTYFSDGKNEPLVKKWLKREISSYTCLTEEARLCRGTLDEFKAYIDKFEIDPGFPDLIRFCQKEEIQLVILSDGLDFYIERILRKYALTGVTYYANHAEFTPDGLKITLPYWNSKCPDCGNCKGERIKTLKSDKDTVIYIGDGFSDLCGVKQADLIFAKDDLAEYLKQDSRDFIEYSSLAEVRGKLERYIKSAGDQAELKG
jgi:2-hydroxy-3-keto-5-methylthiopentenyl-1-phosphate phosphatase